MAQTDFKHREMLSQNPVRCPRCAAPLSKELEASSWSLAPFIRDSFSMIGTAIGGSASAFYGFNHGMPYVQRLVKGPMWLHFLIGVVQYQLQHSLLFHRIMQHWQVPTLQYHRLRCTWMTYTKLLVHFLIHQIHNPLQICRWRKMPKSIHRRSGFDLISHNMLPNRLKQYLPCYIVFLFQCKSYVKCDELLQGIQHWRGTYSFVHLQDCIVLGGFL